MNDHKAAPCVREASEVQTSTGLGLFQPVRQDWPLVKLSQCAVSSATPSPATQAAALLASARAQHSREYMYM